MLIVSRSIAQRLRLRDNCNLFCLSTSNYVNAIVRQTQKDEQKIPSNCFCLCIRSYKGYCANL